MLPHRSPWSHLPFLSTLIRFGYLLIPLAIGSFAFGIANVVPLGIQLAGPLFGLYLGLAISDSLHWLFDKPFLRRFSKLWHALID